MDAATGETEFLVVTEYIHGVAEAPLIDCRKTSLVARTVIACQQIGRSQRGPFNPASVKVQEPFKVACKVLRICRGIDEPRGRAG
jgi:hypothetical protein